MGQAKIAITPLLTHWGYYSLVLMYLYRYVASFVCGDILIWKCLSQLQWRQPYIVGIPFPRDEIAVVSKEGKGISPNVRLARCACILPFGGTILLMLLYRVPDGIKIDSAGTNRRKWRVVSSNVVFLTWFHEKKEWHCQTYIPSSDACIFSQVHSQIHGKHSRF